MKEFEPTFTRGGDMTRDVLPGAPIRALQQMASFAGNAASEKTKGLEVGYQLFGIKDAWAWRAHSRKAR
jgi:hypothetical protein